MKVAYIVSRFPAASETFVIREMDAVEATGDVEISLFSLFPSADGFVHPAAEPWISKLHGPPGRRTLGSLARWLARRPVRLLGSLTRIVLETWRNPRIAVRSVAAAVAACAHADIMRGAGIERVHAHFAAYPTVAAWVCGRLCDIPYSFTAHAYDIFVDQHMLARKVADADFVATISHFNQAFLDPYDAAGTPVELVHCGVDPTAFAFQPRDVPSSGPVRALCVASLQEKKGHAVLFEALAGAKALERVHLDLVGGGEREEALRELAVELGLADRITFHGPRTEAEVRAMLKAADFFILPSIVADDGQMEGLPVALIEAMAAGVPIVASRMSGIPELVEDGVTGFLATPGDADSLQIALTKVLAKQLDLARGRALVETEFDIRRSGERMVALLTGGSRT